ncbi:hypothetical protein [Roseateles sp.]|uniref:hypothetical protein n=1 Tax=Roseateles sp. TaxID=1971397 RepID=UPI002F40449C
MVARKHPLPLAASTRANTDEARDRINWNYHERHDGKNAVISEWRNTVQKKVRVKMDRSLDQLRQMPKVEWHKPAPASNIGDHIYVIRFTDQTGMQIRVFGHFHDPHKAFVMTFVGHEKDGKYVPANYQELAQGHRAHCSDQFQKRTQPYGDRCAFCAAGDFPIRH